MANGNTITHETFTARMAELYPTLKALAKFKGTSYELKVQCLDCNHKFSKCSQAFMYPSRNKRDTGPCPKCKKAVPYISDKDFKQKLAEKRPDVRLKGAYLGCAVRHKFLSLLCGHEFTAMPDPVVNGVLAKGGCKSCTRASMNTKGTQESFLADLTAKHPHLTCKGGYQGLTKKLRFVCAEDGQSFSRTPREVLLSKRGCPECSRRETGYAYTTITVQKRKFKLQGYEPHFVRWVQKKDKALIPELVVGAKVPRFDYEDVSPNNGEWVTRTYRPDFFVPSKNIIVEVKSTYTAAGQKAWLTTLKRKRKAVIAAGYKFLLVVFNDEGQRLTVTKDWHKKSLTKDTITES